MEPTPTYTTTTTAADIRAAILQATLDLTFNDLEAAPAVRAAWLQFKDLVTPLRTTESDLGRALLDAANSYATELATHAFVAGLAFDARALLLETAFDMQAPAR